MSNITVYYFDEEGNYSGQGTSATLPPEGATDIKPTSHPCIWDSSIGNWTYPPLLDPPDPVYSCTPWQIRKALNQLNLRDQVEDMVASSTDRDLKDGWEFASTFRSDDPFVITMGIGLGKDEAEIAELIQWAGTL